MHDVRMFHEEKGIKSRIYTRMISIIEYKESLKEAQSFWDVVVVG